MDAVKTHYERDELVGSINKALEHHGLKNRPLTIEDLAPIDHFHIRGIEATTDIAESLSLTAESKILDIGSGLGGPARFVAKKFGAHVTGIDLTPSYVEAAKHLTELTGLSKLVNFECANALALPFEDESFDSAMTQHVAMNIQNRALFYAEAYRVIKANGKFAIYDVIAGDAGEVYYPVPWADSAATSFLLTEDALKNILTEQKFKISHWEDRTAKALDWVSDVSKRQAQLPDKDQVLGLNVILGQDFGKKAGNLAKSLRDGRAKVIEVLVTK